MTKKNRGALFGDVHIERKPLAVLAAESLRIGIKNGTWSRKFPGETKLSSELGISRSTLRVALEILKREGTLLREGLRRSAIPSKLAGKRPAESLKAVNVLLPFSFEELPNFALFWINELRNQLHAAGRPLHLITSRAFYREKNGEVRERIIQEYPAGCWVLAFSNADVQQWFQDRKLATVIGGLPSPGINLPSVLVDGHAMMFHMLGSLTARGHRRIALVTGDASSTTPFIFLRAFDDTCRKIGADKIEPEVITIREDDPEDVGREIKNAIRRKNGPTGLIIFNPLNAVAAFSYLPANGISIPRDVSIITTFGDSYLDHLNPKPFRYRFDAVAYARKLLDIIQKLEMGISPKSFHAKFMLEPLDGKSVGRPRKDWSVSS